MPLINQGGWFLIPGISGESINYTVYKKPICNPVDVSLAAVFVIDICNIVKVLY